MNYSIQQAINYRGKTFGEEGLYDPETCHPSVKNDVIDFKMSIQLSDKDAYMWEVPDHIQALSGKNNVSKKVWYERWRSYRVYLKQGIY